MTPISCTFLTVIFLANNPLYLRFHFASMAVLGKTKIPFVCLIIYLTLILFFMIYFHISPSNHGAVVFRPDAYHSVCSIVCRSRCSIPLPAQPPALACCCQLSSLPLTVDTVTQATLHPHQLTSQPASTGTALATPWSACPHMVTSLSPVSLSLWSLSSMSSIVS